MTDAEPAAIVVLAGGEGARMGGDKPLRLWRGQRLIDRALALAHGYGEDVAIAVRRADQIGATRERQLVDRPDVAGPLAGLHSALAFAAECGRSYVLTIPCDCPLLPADLLRVLREGRRGACCAVLPRSGGVLHPACGLWDVSALERLPAYIASGRLSLWRFAEAVGVHVVDWAIEAADPFANANTPEDLERLQAGRDHAAW